ncbi:hypothetical protein NADFUDRAFT_84185 [Nadsonia fulvescens var. elongata DSM 6958]|uniref:Uncharacterized protein n=1 Tax=Nadsonia fulvescens var. elongata DSM 6958 TaxID=857566 RepID=A0A1E3PDR5_9ASCO|nr:hypothetical protein NADFUDRAFT_84185 [Nadsonia fulvescens var. elongata DSM 6958]
MPNQSSMLPANPATPSRKTSILVPRKPCFRPLLPKPPASLPVDTARSITCPTSVVPIPANSSVRIQQSNSIENSVSPQTSSPLDIGANVYNAISIASSPSSANGVSVSSSREGRSYNSVEAPIGAFNGPRRSSSTSSHRASGMSSSGLNNALFNSSVNNRNCSSFEITPPSVFNSPRRSSSVSNRRTSTTTGPNSKPTISKRPYSMNNNTMACSNSVITTDAIPTSPGPMTNTASSASTVLTVSPPASVDSSTLPVTTRYQSFKPSNTENKFISIGQPANLRNLPITIAPSSSSFNKNVNNNINNSSHKKATDVSSSRYERNVSRMRIHETNPHLDGVEYNCGLPGLAGSYSRSVSSGSRTIGIDNRTSTSTSSGTGRTSRLSAALVAASSNSSTTLGSGLSSAYASMGPTLSGALEFQSSLDSFDNMLNSIEPVGNFDLAKPATTGVYTWPDALESSNGNTIPLWDPSEILNPRPLESKTATRSLSSRETTEKTTTVNKNFPVTEYSSGIHKSVDDGYKNEIDEILYNIKFDNGFSSLDDLSLNASTSSGSVCNDNVTLSKNDNKKRNEKSSIEKTSNQSSTLIDESLMMDNNDFFSFLDTGINI